MSPQNHDPAIDNSERNPIKLTPLANPPHRTRHRMHGTGLPAAPRTGGWRKALQNRETVRGIASSHGRNNKNREAGLDGKYFLSIPLSVDSRLLSGGSPKPAVVLVHKGGIMMARQPENFSCRQRAHCVSTVSQRRSHPLHQCLYGAQKPGAPASCAMENQSIFRK